MKLHTPAWDPARRSDYTPGEEINHITFLYRLFSNQEAPVALQDNAKLTATITRLTKNLEPDFVVPGWEKKEIPLPDIARASRKADEAPIITDLPQANGFVLDVNEIFETLSKMKKNQTFFGFEALFFESFTLRLNLEVDGVILASDQHIFEIFNDSLFGSLYERIINKLIPWDVKQQVNAKLRRKKLPDSYHPWFPVLCIGMEKANLYMKGIRDDMVEKKGVFTDPSWLLRVGLYLELLTCLGVVEVVREKGIDLLTPKERDVFETSPAFENIRRKIDLKAWSDVWKQRWIVFPRAGTPGNMPVSFRNL